MKKFLNKYILSYFGLTLMSKEDIKVLVRHEIHHYEYNRLLRGNKQEMYNITKGS